MPIRRVLPVLLVLLQSGLAAGHAHSNLAAHTDVPHLHDLLDLFVPDHDDHEHDGVTTTPTRWTSRT